MTAPFTATARIVLLAAGLLGLLAPAARAGDAPWGDLRAWVGKYPTQEDATGRKRTRIWQVPGVERALRAQVGSADLRRITSVYTNEVPIRAVEQLVIIELCKPHDCPNAHAMVVLDTTGPRLWVGLFERTGKRVTTRWSGPTDHLTLPTTILEQFRRGHTAE